MPDLKGRILDAAHQLMLTVGLARTTTKEIARAAGCSEAALYKHFASKEDLFLGVLTERLPQVGLLLSELIENPGRATLAENLGEIVRRAAQFYDQSFPIAASLYAELGLKQRHDRSMRERGKGPHLPIEGVAAYLRVEQEAGRVRSGVDVDAAAGLLLGACALRSFAYDMREAGPPELDAFVDGVVRTLLAGLDPAT